MAGLLASFAAQSMLKAALPAIGVAAVVLAGSFGAEWIEHNAPWGLKAQRDRAQALAVTNAANWRSMKAWGEGWWKAEGRCEFTRTTERDNAALALQAAEAANRHSASSAFASGVAYGRATPLKGSPDAKPAPGALPGADPLGLRDGPPGPDFASQWTAGAYNPESPVLPGARGSI